MDKNQPIGFMDSGLGGLSVLKEAMRLLPHEDFIYIGDSANAPYGIKSVEEIQACTSKVVESLLEKGVKAITIACNTATSASAKMLRERYPEMIIIGIEPAIKPAAINSKGGSNLVLATPMTVKQEKFQKLLKQYEAKANLIPVACGGLMDFVEKNTLDGPEIDAYFKEHIEPYVQDDLESVVLGCTHYPFLKPYMKRYFKEGVKIIDGSVGTAKQLKRRLKEEGLLRDDAHQGELTLLNTKNTTELIDLSKQLLEMNIDF